MSLPNGTWSTSPSGRASDSGTNVWRMPNRPVVTAPHTGRSDSSRYSSSNVPILSPSRSTTVRPRQSSAVSMSSGGMWLLCRGSCLATALPGPGHSNAAARPGYTPAMSTALIVVIVAVVLLLLVLLALQASRKRARAQRQGRVEARARGADPERRHDRDDDLEPEAERFALDGVDDGRPDRD